MRTVRSRISAFVTAARALWRGQPGAQSGRGEPVQATEKQDDRPLTEITLAAAGLAHDLNNLLTVISGASELSLLKSSDPEARRQWSEVLEASQLAAELTQSLMSLSRREMLQLSPVSPNRIIQGSVELLSRLAGDRVTVRTSLAADKGLILSNPTELVQVLMNLVLNAREAMPSGGSLVIETRAHVQADRREGSSGSRTGRYVVLTVADTGAGMDEATKSRAFHAFFSTKADSERTGLGLAIVSAAVRKSGGHVNVHSAPGAGTRFELYFPEAEPADRRTGYETDTSFTATLDDTPYHRHSGYPDIAGGLRS
jgi:two-component system cell cycle sensor histidine kinase/response regulator CckA